MFVAGSWSLIRLLWLRWGLEKAARDAEKTPPQNWKVGLYPTVIATGAIASTPLEQSLAVAA